MRNQAPCKEACCAGCKNKQDVFLRKAIGESGFAMEGVKKNTMTIEKMNEFLKKNPFLGC